jgi:hypothetical protein
MDRNLSMHILMVNFNGQFYCSHPSIYLFLDVVLKLQTISYIKIRSINEKVPLSRADKEKEQSLIDLHNQYVSGTITREKYTRTYGYKYQARTDMQDLYNLIYLILHVIKNTIKN